MEQNQDVPIMPPVGSAKKLVFEHRTGRLAGLHQILGQSVPPYPDIVAITRIPEGEPVSCSLIRVHRGGVYYREVPALAPSRFGQHTVFDPEQR